MKLLDKSHEKTELLAIRGENNIDREVEVVLKGLGFKPEDLDRNCEEFSGGWRMRIELAKILLARPDIFLLDEPTNHLDIESISWLESFLQTYSGAVVLVSHDRAFLDNVTTRTLEISLGKVYDYKVAYSQFEQLHKERIGQQMRANQNQQKQIKDTEDFIERFRYKATKSVQVQSRIKQLEKLERIEVEEEDMARITVRFQPAVRSGEIFLTGKELTKAYGDHVVLKGIQLDIKRGEKIAFVGESGSGKSTLIKILLGLLKYNQGEVRLGDMELKEICLNNLYDRVSYLSQDAPVFDGTIKENLVFEKQVSEEQMLGALSEVQLSHLVENLAEGLNTEIGEKGTCLSGGEKQRLALARLWFEDSELVILDEATSAMDNLTEENVMKSVMQKMKDKTVIAIAHRLNSIAGFDRIILFKEGRIVGQGTFEELLHTDSYFMDLYNANVK